MGRLTPVFGVLGLLGFAVLHACSSEDGAGGGKKESGGGSGGDGGDGAPGTGGSSGSAGKGGAGGTAGSSKGGAGGAAGQAGEPNGGTAGESGSAGEGGMGAVGPGPDCTVCIDGGNVSSPRAVLLDECADSPPCSAWLTCARGCSDAACLDTCDAANPSVEPYRFAIYSALCDACATQCSALELCDRDCTDNVSLPLQPTAPATLAETGLYTSAGAAPTAVAPYARSFRPEYELWSDGAVKQRWAYVPRCGRIGTDGINHWIFPVGTRLWKEFSIPSGGVAGTVRVETRFLHKFGTEVGDWVFASYQWPANNASPTAADATLASPEDGVMNANGTQHDIPSVAQCRQCHEGLVERVLGFSAYQLSHNLGGVNIRELADAGWLTHPAASTALGGGLARNGFDPPGSAADQRALGYLHANCGNCHNFNTMVPPASPVRMRLMVGANTLQATDTYTSLVNVATFHSAFVNCDRIEPGDASRSEILMRMGRRPTLQMPPLGTEQVHAAAITELTAWINAMPAAGPPSTCVPQ